MSTSSKLQKQDFSSLNTDVIRFLMTFLSKKDVGLVFQLNKKWLDLIIKMKNSEYRSAVLQCLVLTPNQCCFDRLYKEACLAATALSCHWYWMGNASDSKRFIRSSEIYAKALVRFFQNREKDYKHLAVMKSQLYPSLKKYPSGKAQKITLGILQKHAPYLLLDENEVSCMIS